VENDRPLSAVALDTSIIISGLLSWHENHETASAELVMLLEEPVRIILPLHALVEAYAVMTRMPPPHRLSSKQALAVLEGSFRNRLTLVGLDGEEGWDLIRDLDQQSIAGGASYDGLIVACARKGGAKRILTFNRKHFERMESEDIEVVVPGSTQA
jgi:predicted nucleic acid-binding protein